MLDQWLNQLAEEELEKTANADLEKVLDSMSIPELKAYYSLLDKTAQEATPPLPAQNVPALETPTGNTPPPPEDQIAAQGQVTPAAEVPPGPLTPEVQAAEAKVQEAIQLYQSGQIGDEELQAAIDNYNQLTNTAKVAHVKFAAADLAGRTIAHSLFKQAALKKKELSKEAISTSHIIAPALGGISGAVLGGLSGGIGGAVNATPGNRWEGFTQGAEAGLLPGAVVGASGAELGNLLGAGITRNLLSSTPKGTALGRMAGTPSGYMAASPLAIPLSYLAGKKTQQKQSEEPSNKKDKVSSLKLDATLPYFLSPALGGALGAGAGALGGGVTGALSAEPGSRGEGFWRGTVPGAITGGTIGALGGLGGAITGRSLSKNENITGLLERLPHSLEFDGASPEQIAFAEKVLSKGMQPALEGIGGAAGAIGAIPASGIGGLMAGSYNRGDESEKVSALKIAALKKKS